MSTDIHIRLAAITAISLESMSDIVLAVASNAVQGFGKLSTENMAFSHLRELGLIREDGVPMDKESLIAALSAVINGRVEAGTWGKE